MNTQLFFLKKKMRNNFYALLTLTMTLFASSFLMAGSSDFNNYISKYKYTAIQEMKRTGIPASIKLAQGLLESGAGKSYLAVNGNNHFGIKCGGSWTGKTIYRKDDDYKNGKLVPSCFRRYKSALESYKAHSEFLIGNYRYHKLFELKPTDYKGWAKGLKAAGYATKRTYAQDLIRLIETYRLYEHDKALPTKVPVVEQQKQEKEEEIKKAKEEEKIIARGRPVIVTNNDVKMTYVLQGENLKAISKRTKVSTRLLMKYNEELDNVNEKLVKGTRVYLQPKRGAYRGKKNWHEVKASETMFSISQQYGIRLDRLYQRNLMKKGEEPIVGEHISLRTRIFDKPVLKSSLTPVEKPQNPLDKLETSDQKTIPDEDGDGLIDTEGVVTAEELKRDNATADSVRVKEEMVELPKTIILPIEEETLPEPTSVEVPKQDEEYVIYYKVKPKDTLFGIARKHNLSLDELRGLNPEKQGNTIHIDEMIRVQ